MVSLARVGALCSLSALTVPVSIEQQEGHLPVKCYLFWGIQFNLEQMVKVI